MRPARAFALGLLHGPAELLPVSSSAHAGLLLQDLEPERRKELEVALHAGTLAALGLPRPRAWLVAATAPARARGLPVRAADRAAPRHPADDGDRPRRRRRSRWPLADQAGARPLHEVAEGPGPVPEAGRALGIAQACALVPGVSRHGAALTALRALGFSRPRAHALSREASKPVLLGATVLKGVRVPRRGSPRSAAAAAGSAISTSAARRALAGRGVRAPLWPFALYRAALAASVWRHGRS